MLLSKQKKNQVGKGNRFLISITVLGSAGPIRFVVNEEELVAAVIDTALKSYAREGRLPVLGSDLSNFVLYCPLAGMEGNEFLHNLSVFIRLCDYSCWLSFILIEIVNYIPYLSFLDYYVFHYLSHTKMQIQIKAGYFSIFVL